MKTIKHLFLAILATTVLSCSNDDTSNSAIIPEVTKDFRISIDGVIDNNSSSSENSFKADFISDNNMFSEIFTKNNSGEAPISLIKDLTATQIVGVSLKVNNPQSILYGITVKIVDTESGETVLNQILDKGLGVLSNGDYYRTEIKITYNFITQEITIMY